MARSLVENADVPIALRWELVRAAYFARHGFWDRADVAQRYADNYQSRLNELLADSIQPTDSIDVMEAA